MDLLIKGICLPHDGLLNLTIHEDGRVENYSTYAGHRTAIEVPPHGRLIDADDLIDRLSISAALGSRKNSMEVSNPIMLTPIVRSFKEKLKQS